MKEVHQADDLFVCFGAKPNKGPNFDATGSGQGNASQQSWKKELREGSWRRVTQKGSRQRSAEGSSEGKPVRMSWHS